jgi:hypothetical protein
VLPELHNSADIRASDLFKRHVSRLRAALSAHSQDTICQFLTTHTRLRGEPFTFKGHEYQERILSDTSQEIIIPKSAQIGISEMAVRLAIARTALTSGFNTIYTLPSAGFARTFMNTRVNPVIRGSPYLRELVQSDMDNSEVKQFGESFLFVKGAQVDRQAISVPADLLVIDELNNSSVDVVTLYESRLIHSPFALRVKLSTPTIPGYGISALFDESRQHFNLVKCCHCGEWFFPSYYDHVRIPDFDKGLDTITRSMFADARFRWREAYVACPKCGKPVNLMPEHREWVVKNPDAAYTAAGYQVSPFDCPTVVKISNLVHDSTTYERPRDFRNQRLGEPMEDKETSLMRDELLALLIDDDPGSDHPRVMGLDMGNTCWCTIADVLPDQSLVVIYTEAIPLAQVRTRRRELAARFRVRMTVCDSGPNTETVWVMQGEDPNLFAAVYVESKNVELFVVKEKAAIAAEGKLGVRQVNIARNRALDYLMLQLRTSRVLKVRDANDDTWVSHLTDMKRVEEFRRDELTYVWVKTRGEDHLHHTLLYALIASKMLGVSTGAFDHVPVVLGKFSTITTNRTKHLDKWKVMNKNQSVF